MPRTRGTTYPAEVIDRARALAMAGQTPTQIQRLLKREHRGWDPALSTVKLWVRGVPPPAADGPWEPTEASTADCAAMAPYLLHGADRATELGEPSLGWPTEAEARWMLRVRAWAPRPSPAYPDAPSMSDARVWELGRYIAASAPDERRRLVRSLLASMTRGQDEGFRAGLPARQAAGIDHGGTALGPEGIGPSNPDAHAAGAATRGAPR